MGLFGMKKDKELERVLTSLAMNVENNYKDASIKDLKELLPLLEEKVKSGALNARQEAHYKALSEKYMEELKNYGHNDQKPYWTKE